MLPETVLTLSLVILLLPLLGFTILIFFGKKLGRLSGVIETSILLISFLLAIVVAYSKISLFNDIKIIQSNVEWINFGQIPKSGTFSVIVGIGLDNLSAIMLIVVTLISFLVHLFSIGHMADDVRFSRYFAYLGFFTFSMLGIVLTNNFLLMYIFWELVGISSYLLIGHWYERKSASDAAHASGWNWC